MTSSNQPKTHYPWIAPGDINGFFGLVVDNLSILGFLATALIGIFGFPAEIVFGRMFPGTALGVLVGNLIYTGMARRLALRSGRDDVTAMPLGLDAPTTIGLALLVLGPAFVAYKQAGMDANTAALATWHLGMAAMIVMGILKLVLSFFGEAVSRAVPRAGLLGSIAGIALMLMGFLPLLEAMRVPVIGLVTLGLLLYALIAKGPIPWRMPGVLFAFSVGITLYFGLGAGGLLGSGYQPPQWPDLQLGLPWPTLGFIDGMPDLVRFLPLVLPFGLLMVVGGINVTESARAAGDDYRTRDILLTEAVSTLIAGLCGGVAQTTPYIGQPAYKHMGARGGYTLLTGIFIGVGGMLGLVSGLVAVLPLAVLAPIIIYVAIDITVQSFEATPKQHAPAVVLAFLPSIAYLLSIKLGNPAIVPPEHYAALLSDSAHGISEMAVIVILGNGFIITSMLWATMLAAMIDQRFNRAALTLLLAALLTTFGVIHSVKPQGGLYLPWQLGAADFQLAVQWISAYLVLAATLWAVPKLARVGAVDRH